MTQTTALKELAELINKDRRTVLDNWRVQVSKLPSAKHLDVPTLNDHIPYLLDEISAALSEGSHETIPEALLQESPPAHGLQRLKVGFDIEEVVAEYNILRGTIHDLAEEHGLSIQGEAFHILNRVLDGAIGTAVKTFAEERAREIQQRRDDYLAFVVHDLRTPLSAVSLGVTILEFQANDKASEPNPQVFKIVGRNLARIDALVSKIIEESVQTQSDESENLERREFDLWPVVERLIEDLRLKMQQSQTRLVNSIPHDLTVYADANLVARVLQNLMSNALRYAPSGRVEIGGRNDPKSNRVECWVSDDGSGIPQDLIGKVFDKLESDPENEEGTGLGLAIVKHFVELHGGTVTVESESGSGATFRFTLPSKESVSG